MAGDDDRPENGSGGAAGGSNGATPGASWDIGGAGAGRGAGKDGAAPGAGGADAPQPRRATVPPADTPAHTPPGTPADTPALTPDPDDERTRARAAEKMAAEAEQAEQARRAGEKTVISTAAPSGVDIGTKIMGTFEITQHIATGGMGEVYRGVNIHTQEPVAIKIVLAALAHDEKILSLFQKEATVLGRLHHDAIVRYQLFTVDPGIQRACLVMEFVEGRSVAEYIQDQGAMPLGDVKILISRMASGLQKAHDLGVVHRDLSPDNMIIQDGLISHAKIIDFGIAKSANFGGGTLLGGQFAGKYNYVSPEQLGRYNGHVTARSDIYSAALVIVAACRGEQLDMGDNPAEAVERRMQVPDLSGVPDELAPLLAKMLEPNPDDRPASMTQVLEYLDNPALLQAVGGAAAATGGAGMGAAMPAQTAGPQDFPQSAPPYSLPPQSLPPGSVPPAGFAPGAGDSDSPFGAVPAAPISGTAPATGLPGATSQPADPSNGNGKSTVIMIALLLLLAGGGAGAYFAGLLDPVLNRSTVETPPVDGTGAGQDTATDAEPPANPGVGESIGSGDSIAALPEPEPPASPAPDQPDPDPQPDADPAPDADPDADQTASIAPPDTTADPTEGEELPAGPDASETALNDLDAVGARIEWLRNYELPSCVYTSILGVTPTSFEIEGFATSVDPFWQLLTDFREAHGTEPEIGVRLIKDSQCAVVNFLKSVAGSDATAPRLTLDKDVLRSGEAIRGRVEQINGRPIWLMLVDAQGGTYDLSSRLKPQEDGTATFALGLRPNALTAGDELVPQMILAVATDAPLDSVAVPAGTTSESLMPIVQGEISSKGERAAATVGYFRFDTTEEVPQ